ncbi:hypothetical protein E9228_001531 [Curtobacterium flaccumfaciens]|uniref:Ricin B lectin domain-containing protein n=1 Tax=Curtobacterium salicis TaxID=1779862 RepID=A0ABX0TAR4_9MICO|nr:hypothetical protein [Curtobacterium sp. WW7]NII40895.1 hypothetical protein [Curtobacterium sp. WW7]
MKYHPFLLGTAVLTAALCAGTATAPETASATRGADVASAPGARTTATVPQLPVIPGSSTTITAVDGAAPASTDGTRPRFEVDRNDVTASVESSADGTLTVVDRNDPWNADDDEVIATTTVAAGTTDVDFTVDDGLWEIDAFVVTDDDRQTSPAAITVRKALTAPDDVTLWDKNPSIRQLTVVGTTYPGADVRVVDVRGDEHRTTARADGAFGISFAGTFPRATVAITHNNDEVTVQPKGGGKPPVGPADPTLDWPIIEQKDLRGGRALFTSPVAGESVALTPVRAGTGLLQDITWASKPTEQATAETVSWAIPKTGGTAQVVVNGNRCVQPSSNAAADGRVILSTCRTSTTAQQFTAVERAGGTVLQSRSNRDRYLTLGEDGRVALGSSDDAAQLAAEDDYSDSWSVEEPVADVADRSVTLAGTKIPGATVTINGAPIETAATRAAGDDSTWTTTLRHLPVGVAQTLVVEQLVGSSIVGQEERTVQLDAAALADVDQHFDDDVTRPAQVTGTAVPGATVQLLRDGAPVGTPVTAGGDRAGGAFAVDVPAPNAGGVHDYTVEQLLDGIAVGADQSVSLDYGAAVSIDGVEGGR